MSIKTFRHDSNRPCHSRVMLFCILIPFLSSCAHHPHVVAAEPCDELITQSQQESTPVTHEEIKKVEEIPKKEIVEEMPKKEIKVGERLDYIFDCFGVPSARMYIEVKEITDVGGKPCYHVVAHAQPRMLFSFFYNVRYDVETYIDAETKLPLKFYKRKTHSRRITEEKITFDYAQNTALWEYTGKKSITVPLIPDTQDLLSAIYHFRSMNIKPGNSYPLDILYNGEIWKVTVKVGNLQRMKLNGGKPIKTFPAEPITDLAKYVTGEQKLVIHFTADQRRIPVIFKIHSKMSPLIGVIRRMPQE
jgi:hypothetical protein